MRNHKRSKYLSPEIELVRIDSDIALILQSDPPADPGFVPPVSDPMWGPGFF